MHDFDLGLNGRGKGLTHVIDKGLGPRGWEDVLETSGHLIDIVKLGWGTSYVTNGLERKLEGAGLKLTLYVTLTFMKTSVLEEARYRCS